MWQDVPSVPMPYLSVRLGWGDTTARCFPNLVHNPFAVPDVCHGHQHRVEWRSAVKRMLGKAGRTNFVPSV
jgi:hypothetical protein